jgi:hypothetical protein
MATATYDKIATTTLGSAASSITFSSIAASWTDLRLVFVGNSSAASRYLVLQFNGDSTTNYSMTYMVGDGTTAASSGRTSDTSLYTNNYGGSSTTIPQFITADIFSYAGSTYKTVLCTTSSDKNGTGNTDTVVGLWRNTSAITSVSMQYLTTGSNINTGTTATLYGIKAA